MCLYYPKANITIYICLYEEIIQPFQTLNYSFYFLGKLALDMQVMDLTVTYF